MSRQTMDGVDGDLSGHFQPLIHRPSIDTVAYDCMALRCGATGCCWSSGYFLVMLWPSPSSPCRMDGYNISIIIVVELNWGQMISESGK